MAPGGRVRAWIWLGVAAVTLTAVYIAAYGDLIGRFFTFDDFAVLNVADSLQIRGPADLVRVFRPWPSFAQYRPLTTVGYFGAARALFGVDPTSWMVAQLAFHVVNALLVYLIAGWLLGSRPAGLATALVYASAPGHALAVRWIAFFTITGTVLAYFTGLLVWLRASDRWRVPATTAIFVVSLLCSEHAVSFPAAVTAVAVLGQGRRDWRRLAREIAPIWLIGAAYLGAKLAFVYVLWPRQAPLAAAFFQKAYALDFEPSTALTTLGRYLGAAVSILYAPDWSPAQHVAAGKWLLAVTVAAAAGALWRRTARRWLGVTACGLALFLAGIAPVVFLPTHVYLAYVGIPALGAALAIVAPVAALPRGGAVALAVAAAFVAVHLRSSGPEMRKEPYFRGVDTWSRLSAAWLHTVQRAAGPDTQEIVVPLNALTGRMFGIAHRLFLCATYEVRPVQNPQAVAPRPGLVIVRDPGPLPADEAWRSIVRDCSG